jgi:hypothetical protein
MGAWGVGPFDNDTAGDMLAKFRKPIERALKSKDDYDYYEARVAAQILVLSHGTDILGGPGLLDVVKLLVMMRSDKEFVSGWKSPRRMAATLDTEIAHVLDVMRLCRGCKRKEPDGEVSALDQARALVVAMEPWNVPRSRPRSRVRVKKRRK